MDTTQTIGSKSTFCFLGMTSYQWLVLFAAWLGWGFDVFDAHLFNYVAATCIPSLLGKEGATPQAITLWTGVQTSVLLVGWALGGVLFGRLTDAIGRARTLMFTILTYALATAACAFAPNLGVLLVLRFVASLGIAGEWAAGAALVAETVPEEKRVHAGAMLYTASPMGLFLATWVNDLLTRKLDYFVQRPDLAWRVAFLTTLVPVAFAFVVRKAVREPEVWQRSTEPPQMRELFQADLRGRTLGGLLFATLALLTVWSCAGFLPVLSGFLVQDVSRGIPNEALAVLKTQMTTRGAIWFNLGGFVGTLLTAPLALRYGRRRMFMAYFLLSAVAIYGTFGLNLAPFTRLASMFWVGVTVFGVMGAFTFYLPELYPIRLRGLGSGFSFNAGRLLAAAGPFVVGWLAQSVDSSREILRITSWVAVIPLLGVVALLLGVGAETKQSEAWQTQGGD